MEKLIEVKKRKIKEYLEWLGEIELIYVWNEYLTQTGNYEEVIDIDAYCNDELSELSINEIDINEIVEYCINNYSDLEEKEISDILAAETEEELN